MAFDRLYLANCMLIEIGEKTLPSLGTDSKSQRLAEDIIDGNTAETFALPIDYHFATAYAELTRIAVDPAFGYDHQYKMPDGCVRVISTIDENYQDLKYKYERGVYCHVENGQMVQDDVLLCDQDKVFIKFIVLRTNPGRWPAWFTRLVVLKGARKMCVPLSENDYRKLSIKQDYKEALADAMAANGLDAMNVTEDGRDEFSGEKNIADGFM